MQAPPVLRTNILLTAMDVSDGFNSARTDLPYNFIKEIQVQTGGYEAEFKSSLGGLVNVITNSGTNELHGTAFGFYTSNKFVSKNKQGSLDPSLGVFSQYDIGVGLGGAIIKDALWYYLSYNPNFNTHDVEVPGFGIYIDRQTKHLFAGKLSWRATENLQLNFSTNGDPGFRKAVYGGALALKNPDSYFTDIKSGGMNYSLNGTYSSKKILIESAIAAVTSFDKEEPSTDYGKKNILFDSLGTVSGGLANVYTETFTLQELFRVHLTYFTGQHKIKSGAEYKDNKFEDVSVDNNYIWWYGSYYHEWLFHNNGTTHVRTPSFFIQDSWQLKDWLNINYGIRWDGQYIIGSR